jgi:uncharacterized protein (UPF0335 family)
VSGIGHNGQIKSFVDRIERLMDEKDGLANDIRDVFTEAKDSDLDVKVLRRVIRERAKDQAARRTENETFDTYWAALNGMSDLA